jgi:tetratricopeptide (TPR) repeat protein
MEWMTDDRREKAIADYERIIEDYAEVAPDEMDDALYHLEHLLFERERRAFEDAQQVYESRREQADATGTAAPPEPKPRYPAARAIAERLVREFPDSSLAEDALYDLGYMRSEEGDRAGASAMFERLARENPRSRYAPEAHFRVAEYAFETNRLVDAEKHYVLALRRGVTGFTDKALFKLGWIYHDLRRPDEAKRTLSMLLERQVREIEAMGAELAPLPSLFFPAPRRSEIPDARRRSVDDVYPETLEALARVYAEAGGAAALLDFVNGHDRDGEPPRYAAPLLHRLALAQRAHASSASACGASRALGNRSMSKR